MESPFMDMVDKCEIKHLVDALKAIESGTFTDADRVSGVNDGWAFASKLQAIARGALLHKIGD